MANPAISAYGRLRIVVALRHRLDDVKGAEDDRCPRDLNAACQCAAHVTGAHCAERFAERSGAGSTRI